MNYVEKIRKFNLSGLQRFNSQPRKNSRRYMNITSIQFFQRTHLNFVILVKETSRHCKLNNQFLWSSFPFIYSWRCSLIRTYTTLQTPLVGHSSDTLWSSIMQRCTLCPALLVCAMITRFFMMHVYTIMQLLQAIVLPWFHIELALLFSSKSWRASNSTSDRSSIRPSSAPTCTWSMGRRNNNTDLRK